MSETDEGSVEQRIYWDQLVLVKQVKSYIRRYRDELARWVDGVGLVKAIVTSGTIGAWAIWKEYALVWGGLLAVTQVLDAAKEYLPRSRNRRNASDFVAAIEGLFIDARFEWHAVFTGQCSAAETMERWRNLARALNELEAKHFPDGLPVNARRRALAEREAQAYFERVYITGGIGDVQRPRA